MFKRILRLLRGRQAVRPSGLPDDTARLIFARADWDAMLDELRRRGLNGKREAGAFLLARRDGDTRRIERIVYLDDLDPACLVGSIHFDGSGYSKLWAICEEASLEVRADVHTHPGSWVSQSEVDRENPMLALRGHLALILPDYAVRPVAPNEVGVHEYRGDDGWQSALGEEAARLLAILEN